MVDRMAIVNASVALLKNPEYISSEEAKQLIGNGFLLRRFGAHEVIKGVYARVDVLEAVERMKASNALRAEPMTERVEVLLSTSLLQAVASACAGTGVSRSDYIRKALLEKLERA